MANTELKRVISFPQIIFYGLGTMVGGGFYALTGKVAGLAGMAVPIAFLIAGIVALINAFTFAELSARYPYSAGEARYVHEAFNKKWLAQLVGWLVISTGVVSAATLAVATIGFLGDLIAIPKALGIIILVLSLGFIAIWGIRESVISIVIITVIEVGALVYIFFAAGSQIETPTQLLNIFPSFSLHIWVGIFSGAFLAFYAFIGFEDMVNVAEEVKNVRHNLPKAILICVGVTTLIYVLVSSVVVMVITPNELAQASTPFAAVLGNANRSAVIFIISVSMLAGINGALVQVVMASRVAYGLAKKSLGPKWFADVNKKTRTPIKATLLIIAIILLLALFFPLIILAKATSTIILLIFAILNLSLLRIKKRGDPAPDGVTCYPAYLPVLGLIVCIGLLCMQFLVATLVI